MKHYISTAIDYPNARPHIGTAFEKIGADVQARFKRFSGRDVFFLMGNDENTVKVVHRAKHLELPVKEYVDKLAVEFKSVWKSLNISNDDFIQTSEERHWIGVQKFIQTVYDAGYIYKKPYSGWYCEGCEEFKLEKNLYDVDGKKVCPNHPLSVIWREEENYFFRLSDFKQFILDWLSESKIQPESRLNEIRNVVETELYDISISRKNEGWGIPIPWDNDQVIYVWFDALLNYLTGIGFGTDEAKFARFWPADCHVIGKDITRFHCALWPAMIAAYNTKAETPIAYPNFVFAHGFIYQNKAKISKTGSSVDPMELIDKYGCDAYRYYFLSKCSFNSDGEYSVAHFNEVYNGELANNLGNLVSRTCNMILQYGEGLIPNYGEEVCWLTKENLSLWHDRTLNFEYREALQIVWGILNNANQYIEQQKPWVLAKTDKKKCLVVLRNLAACLRSVSLLLKPYLPETAERIYDSFLFGQPFQAPDVTFLTADWQYLQSLGENNYDGLDRMFSLNPKMLVAGEILVDEIRKSKYPPMFPRIAV